MNCDARGESRKNLANSNTGLALDYIPKNKFSK